MSDPWKEGRRQLKISRAAFAQRVEEGVNRNTRNRARKELSNAARKVLKTTNLGRTTIANARAVAGRTATIPVKNMKTSMALEKKPSVLSRIARGALKIGGPVGLAYLAIDTTKYLYHTLQRTHKEARQYAAHRSKRHARKAQIPKAKHASKIINSALLGDKLNRSDLVIKNAFLGHTIKNNKKNQETMDRWYNSKSRIYEGDTWGRNRNYKKSYEDYQARLRGKPSIYSDRGKVTSF